MTQSPRQDIFELTEASSFEGELRETFFSRYISPSLELQSEDGWKCLNVGKFARVPENATGSNGGTAFLRMNATFFSVMGRGHSRT